VDSHRKVAQGNVQSAGLAELGRREKSDPSGSYHRWHS
jgi:hypothetical protein